MHKVVETYILKNNLSNEAEFWPLLKCQVNRHVNISSGIEDMEFKSKSYVSLFFFLILSLVNLLIARFNKKGTAYFGAFSRVSVNEGVVHDEFVSEEQQTTMIPLYHCSNFEGVKILTCLKHGVIFENLIVKLLCLFIKRLSSDTRVPVISDGFIELLNQEYGVSKQKIQAILVDYECKKVAYKLLLKWLDVQNVEIISAYTKPAIVSAANDLGITTLEYQHGLLAPYHSSYCYAGVELWRSSLLPKRLKLYSNFWQMKMRKANFVDKEAIEVEGALPETCDELKKQAFSLVGNDKYFIFTGQGICYSEVAIFIQELISKYPDYTVVYRPHPREHQNHTRLSEKVANSRFKVIDRDSWQDTLSLVGASKAHFSIFSSCHFEALELLGKTYVLDVVENNVMKQGEEDGNIIFITKASQIMDI
ncbi:hypothetical protein A9257_21760 [Vibrio cyclitrophicus]|uniref:hypothetical protein n=1 Tax=Vibrio cyclitrophicus TaxID=47951 RepID=UPI0007EEEAD9|nr:hypothetical protein [Vibrio cyclitrophicus]OBS99069.1 hypothetical protein A9257_21760 [Vibrio cyclitrophicus]